LTRFNGTECGSPREEPAEENCRTGRGRKPKQAMNTPRGRPFPPGNTLGRGRPKGSRNKAKAPGQQLLEDNAELLARKCLVLAMQGDRSAMRLCMERILPARRDTSIRMNLPRIRTVQDLDKAAEKVTQEIGRGRLTPAEGETIVNILQIRVGLIENGEFGNRMEKLEEMVAATNRRTRTGEDIEK
jgi:hypothetical protein